MDPQARKKALQMFTYGLYVLTARHGEDVVASTVSWVTQTSFQPPLIAVAIKQASQTYRVVREAGAFALNILGEGQKALASAFFRHAPVEGETVGGHPFTTGSTGAPLLTETPAYVECQVLEWVEQGDHHLAVAEVVNAGINFEAAPLDLRSTGWSYGG